MNGEVITAANEAATSWMTLAVAIQLLATLAAMAAAIFSFSALRAMGRQTKAHLTLTCLEVYLGVRRQRTTAIEAKSAELCQDYYRELFDLHWAEHQLYRRGSLPREEMEAWLDARHRNYEHDKVGFIDSEGTQVKVSYRDAWNNLKSEDYFAPGDPYRRMMDLVHDGRLKEALAKITQ